MSDPYYKSHWIEAERHSGRYRFLLPQFLVSAASPPEISPPGAPIPKATTISQPRDRPNLKDLSGDIGGPAMLAPAGKRNYGSEIQVIPRCEGPAAACLIRSTAGVRGDWRAAF
jgi:hypothetical protein